MSAGRSEALGRGRGGGEPRTHLTVYSAAPNTNAASTACFSHCLCFLWEISFTLKKPNPFPEEECSEVRAGPGGGHLAAPAGERAIPAVAAQPASQLRAQARPAPGDVGLGLGYGARAAGGTGSEEAGPGGVSSVGPQGGQGGGEGANLPHKVSVRPERRLPTPTPK